MTFVCQKLPPARRGFVLLEAMLAVAIFAIGIITLGRCVSNCVTAEHIQQEDALARRALENRLAEIESGAVPIVNPQIENLAPPFAGLKLKQTSEPLRRKNERGDDLADIFAVTLEVKWNSEGETHSKALTFYVSPRKS